MMSAPCRDDLDDVLCASPLFRRLAPADRRELGAIARERTFDRAAFLFREGDPSDCLHAVVTGRVKVFKTSACGRDLILEIFGPGDAVGAAAVYESRPYPAHAVAIAPTTCLLVPRQAFFALLQSRPTMMQGLLLGLMHQIDDLTDRLCEVSGGRTEGRFARFFLKLAGDMGQPRPQGLFIPIALSRQELADMIGTTIETSIRIMSRWGKESVLRTDKDGFLVVDRATLEAAALS